MRLTPQDAGPVSMKQEDAGDGPDGGDTPATQRQRRNHTRSRDGCLTCRKRHKRCDETKPVCINCSTTSRQCEYSQPSVPLRERRATERAGVPGLQQPWTVSTPASEVQIKAKSAKPTPAPPKKPATNWQKLLGKSGDPFSTYSIDMPLESVTLLQYFHRSAMDHVDDPRKNSLRAVIHDPTALRSAVLLASVHYAWSTGQLADFAKTYFFHKVENIRLINTKIQRTMRTRLELCDCIKEVATLAMVEALLISDEVAAESHIQGMLALLEARSAIRDELSSSDTQKTLHEELCDRYVLFVSMLVQGVKTRNADLVDVRNKPCIQPDSQMEAWIQERMIGLKVVCLIPNLFSPPPASTVPRPIDVVRSLEILRSMTHACELKHRWHGSEEYESVRDIMWSRHSATDMWYIGMENHTDSLLAAEEEPRLPSAWSGMYATVAAYENCVIEATNAGCVMDQRLLGHHLAMVDMDLQQARRCLKEDPVSSKTSQSNLWLWKAFTGAFSLGCVEGPLDFGNRALRASFEGHIREAALAFGIEGWDGARQRLETMAWPSRAYKETQSIQTWYRAMLGKAASAKDTTPA
ncbi:uncharacterized protein F5Z01DRAFT_251304 [Emericellopsis atlantica]|uniref:Zn(2)-C6 fungal-type domain-containing protein n=1 Tax=Emericellopsis atlantica TaxID=2614577 RepID=A0A9P7ZI65_9HYPO|nr:uncharacterized protein F5Z01DRAFT_251304 [Emericellopsis atlantica]KAG9252137.1 hypothetical protein F5Z01DRAFT_251304 [Emericellopsis atlantica]